MESDDFRRAREIAAWILLAAATAQVVIGAWTLSGLPGGPASGLVFLPSTTPPFFLPGATPPFADRAIVAIPYLVAVTVTALPVTAVLLTVLGRQPVATARRIALTAVTLQAVALALGVAAWLGSITSTGRWFPVTTAIEIAVAAAGLILTNTVQRSLALRGERRGTAR